MYSWKLAAYYFRKQPDTEDRDRSFIITGSMGSYTDSPVSWSEKLETVLSSSVFINNRN